MTEHAFLGSIYETIFAEYGALQQTITRTKLKNRSISEYFVIVEKKNINSRDSGVGFPLSIVFFFCFLRQPERKGKEAGFETVGLVTSEVSGWSYIGYKLVETFTMIKRLFTRVEMPNLTLTGERNLGIDT